MSPDDAPAEDPWMNSLLSRSASCSRWTTCEAVSCCRATAWSSAPSPKTRRPSSSPHGSGSSTSARRARACVEFSDQLWAFVHRGPYAAFVVAGTSVRPGVMLDQLEQAVITAEETRAKQKEVTLKVPDAASAPSGRPRTSLHPPADRPATAPVASAPAAASAEMPSFAAPIGQPEEAGAEPAWQGADPAQLQQMQAMQEQMAAMQAQLQQQSLQQSPPSESPAPTPPAATPAPASAGSQQLSGYRRPESAGPAAGRPRCAATAPRRRPVRTRSSFRRGVTLRGRARRRAVGGPLQLGILAVREAGGRAGGGRGGVGGRRATEDGGTFRQEPQRLVSPPAPASTAPAPQPEEEPGEVDRVMLAKEFSGLLQVGEDGDED